MIRELLYQLLLYVDDILVTGSNMKDIVNLKARLAEEFSLKDLDHARKILRIRINTEREEAIESITCT